MILTNQVQAFSFENSATSTSTIPTNINGTNNLPNVTTLSFPSKEFASTQVYPDYSGDDSEDFYLIYYEEDRYTVPRMEIDDFIIESFNELSEDELENAFGKYAPVQSLNPYMTKIRLCSIEQETFA